MGTERKVRLQPALSAQTMPVWRRQTHRQIGRHRADDGEPVARRSCWGLLTSLPIRGFESPSSGDMHYKRCESQSVNEARLETRSHSQTKGSTNGSCHCGLHRRDQRDSAFTCCRPERRRRSPDCSRSVWCGNRVARLPMGAF